MTQGRNDAKAEGGIKTKPGTGMARLLERATPATIAGAGGSSHDFWSEPLQLLCGSLALAGKQGCFLPLDNLQLLEFPGGDGQEDKREQAQA